MRTGKTCLTSCWTAMTLSLGVTLLTIGCGDDPIFVTDQISIKIDIKENQIVGNQLEGRKNVSTEVSNPYAHFLQLIHDKFGEQEVEIRVESASIQLQDTKDLVAGFEDLFIDQVEVFLAPDDQAAGYVVALAQAPTGTGPIEMELTDQASELRSFAQTLMGGSFRVGIRGDTQRVPAEKFDCKVAVTLTFGAYEW